MGRDESTRFNLCATWWLGWQDLNLRMPESKSGALTTWRHPSVLKNKWGGRRESNSRPPGPQSGALTNWATPAIILVRLKRFELLTHGLEGRCSIQLSYRRIWYALQNSGAGDGNRTHAASLEGWNSTIELHPHISHSAVASTTPVYNSIIKKNCQTIFALFWKNFIFFLFL